MGLQTLWPIGGQDPPRSLPAAANARLVRRVIEEIWNDGELDLADRLFAPDYVNHGGLIPDLIRGPEAIKLSVALYRTAFPQFRVVVLDLLAQGPLVALRWAAHGTAHRAAASDLEAVPSASGPLLGMTFGRLKGGQIVESWTCWASSGAAPARIAAASHERSRNGANHLNTNRQTAVITGDEHPPTNRRAP
jgi:predicted SnoaL-like aldol condensation-catalyzing enzyme